jgi:translation initiation factor IF-1
MMGTYLHRRAGTPDSALASGRPSDGIAAFTMPDTPVRTQGKVVETRDHALYLVELPNGKRVLAHLAKECLADHLKLTEHELVLLEMTPYDFDHARIVGKA